jgi:hypothetical protein
MARRIVSAASTIFARVERGVEPWAQGRRACVVRRHVERVLHQLAGIDRPRRLDEGEGGHGGQLEPAPGALGAGLEPRGPGRPRGRRLRRSSAPRRSAARASRCSTTSEAKPLCAAVRPKKPAKPMVWMPGSSDSSARRNTSDRTSMQKPTCSAGRSAGSARLGGEGLGQVALHRAFPGLLQDGVGGEIDVDGDGGGMRLHHLGPSLGDLVPVLRNSASSHSSRMVSRSVSVSSVRPQAPPATGGSAPPAPSRPAGTAACAGTSQRLLRQAERRNRLRPWPRRRCRAFR